MLRKGVLEEVGGASYLAKIIDTAPMAVNARHYAKIIKDKAVLGRLITKASTIIQKCHDRHIDVEDAIDFAESSIFGVSGDKIKPSFHQISNIIRTKYRHPRRPPEQKRNIHRNTNRIQAA